VRAREEPLFLEELEVAPDGGGRDPQAVGELRDTDGPVDGDILEDHPQALRLLHGPEV
jgi:hypothetical protein